MPIEYARHGPRQRDLRASHRRCRPRRATARDPNTHPPKMRKPYGLKFARPSRVDIHSGRPLPAWGCRGERLGSIGRHRANIKQRCSRTEFVFCATYLRPRTNTTYTASPKSLKRWWARLGSNQRPLRCQRSALPLSYAPSAAPRLSAAPRTPLVMPNPAALQAPPGRTDGVGVTGARLWSKA